MAKATRLPTQFQGPEDSPGFLLWQVSNAWQREMRHALKSTGITHPQFVLLASMVWLEDQGEVVTQNRLSQQAEMDKMTVSDVIKTLTHKSLVKRVPNPNDRRSLCLRATPQGLAAIQQALPLIEAADSRFFARSPKSTSEIVSVLGSLHSKTSP